MTKTKIEQMVSILALVALLIGSLGVSWPAAYLEAAGYIVQAADAQTAAAHVSSASGGYLRPPHYRRRRRGTYAAPGGRHADTDRRPPL